MIKQLHIASQYLAAAGLSLIKPAPDESHASLAWQSKSQSLDTRVLGLSLRYDDFSIRISKGRETVSLFPLHNQVHFEVLEWINLNLMVAK